MNVIVIREVLNNKAKPGVVHFNVIYFKYQLWNGNHRDDKTNFYELELRRELEKKNYVLFSNRDNELQICLAHVKIANNDILRMFNFHIIVCHQLCSALNKDIMNRN